MGIFQHPRPRQDINRLRAKLSLAEAEQQAKELVKAPPNGKEKYLGNSKHSWEYVTHLGEDYTMRLRVPGGWLYGHPASNLVFVPIPDAVGYAV